MNPRPAHLTALFAPFALTVLLAACSPEDGPAPDPAPQPEATTIADTPERAPTTFVSDDFEVPTRVEGEGFILVPLGPELVQIDYDAYMSSIDHLQRTFTRSTRWPTEDISAADAMLDMETEQSRFEARTSFAYAVLTPDGSRERGCVYVYPSPKPGYDAMVRMWVTQAEFDAGFDPELQAWAEQWLADAWPFEAVAWPGRGIDWDTWEGLPDA